MTVMFLHTARQGLDYIIEHRMSGNLCNNILEMAKSRTEWLLRYSLLGSDDLAGDNFLCFLKNNNISFIDKKKLKEIKQQWHKWEID